MKQIVYLDFDGTLSDCRQRLYKLFCYLTGSTKLSFTQYWQLKCEGENQKKILEKYFHYDKIGQKTFSEKWLYEIEQPKWLAYDTPAIGADTFLRRLAEAGWRCVVVTNRQSYQGVESQILRYGWRSFITDILFTAQKCNKEEIIHEFEQTMDIGNTVRFYIGDMQEDVRTAHHIAAKLLVIRSEAKMGIPPILAGGKIHGSFERVYREMTRSREG